MRPVDRLPRRPRSRASWPEGHTARQRFVLADREDRLAPAWHRRASARPLVHPNDRAGSRCPVRQRVLRYHWPCGERRAASRARCLSARGRSGCPRCAFHSLNTQVRGVAAAFDHGRVVALSLNILCRSHLVAHIAACRYVMSARHGARKCTSLGNGQAMSMAKVGQHKRPGLEG